MRKIIAVGGRPGVGKTTLFREFMAPFTWEEVEPKKTLSSMYCKELDLYVLGKYQEGEVFAGTDRLSMSVQPMAIEFFKETTSNILFEGDRIFNQSFLEFCSELPDVEFDILYLTVGESTLKSRYAERGSNQSDKFLSGRETKYSNITGNFELRQYLSEYKNENKEQQGKILSFINSRLIG